MKPPTPKKPERPSANRPRPPAHFSQTTRYEHDPRNPTSTATERHTLRTRNGPVRKTAGPTTTAPPRPLFPPRSVRPTKRTTSMPVRAYLSLAAKMSSARCPATLLHTSEKASVPSGNAPGTPPSVRLRPFLPAALSGKTPDDCPPLSKSASRRSPPKSEGACPNKSDTLPRFPRTGDAAIRTLHR